VLEIVSMLCDDGNTQHIRAIMSFPFLAADC